MATTRRELTEVEQAQEMVSDGTDAIHYGLVEMGGFVRMTELTPAQRRHMYTQERGNMLTARVMGQQRFLHTIRQQNQGIADGQDTDANMAMEEGEQGESEQDDDAADPTVQDGSDGPWSLLVNQIRDELNGALRLEHYRDAREMQNLVLLVLDNLNCGNFRVEAARNRILNEVADRFDSMAPRHHILAPAVSQRYQNRAAVVRQMIQNATESSGRS